MPHALSPTTSGSTVHHTVPCVAVSRPELECEALDTSPRLLGIFVVAIEAGISQSTVQPAEEQWSTVMRPKLLQDQLVDVYEQLIETCSALRSGLPPVATKDCDLGPSMRLQLDLGAMPQINGSASGLTLSDLGAAQSAAVDAAMSVGKRPSSVMVIHTLSGRWTGTYYCQLQLLGESNPNSLPIAMIAATPSTHASTVVCIFDTVILAELSAGLYKVQLLRPTSSEADTDCTIDTDQCTIVRWHTAAPATSDLASMFALPMLLIAEGSTTLRTTEATDPITVNIKHLPVTMQRAGAIQGTCLATCNELPAAQQRHEADLMYDSTTGQLQCRFPEWANRIAAVYNITLQHVEAVGLSSSLTSSVPAVGQYSLSVIKGTLQLATGMSPQVLAVSSHPTINITLDRTTAFGGEVELDQTVFAWRTRFWDPLLEAWTEEHSGRMLHQTRVVIPSGSRSFTVAIAPAVWRSVLPASGARWLHQARLDVELR